MPHPYLVWTSFICLVLVLLFLDLAVLNRKSHVMRVREALGWSAFWVGIALLFNLGIYLFWPESHPDLTRKQAALQFLTGYLLEASLSVDNLFVFLLVFRFFNVDRAYQHRVLFWGILGAMIMRVLFIAAGVTLIQKFHFIIYIFGIFLVITGFKMAFQKDKEIHPEKNPILRLARKILPVTPHYVKDRLFIRAAGRLMATPLFIVLLVIESTDVVFAVDSIPAILAISRDVFIIYTSNVFAILGLRAVYFALAGIMPMFHYLHYGLSAILVFVGVKMLVGPFYHMPELLALSVVAGILVLSIVISLLHRHPVPAEMAEIADNSEPPKGE